MMNHGAGAVTAIESERCACQGCDGTSYMHISRHAHLMHISPVQQRPSRVTNPNPNPNPNPNHTGAATAIESDWSSASELSADGPSCRSASSARKTCGVCRVCVCGAWRVHFAGCVHGAWHGMCMAWHVHGTVCARQVCTAGVHVHVCAAGVHGRRARHVCTCTAGVPPSAAARRRRSRRRQRG